MPRRNALSAAYPRIAQEFANASWLTSPRWRGGVRIERHRAEFQQLETTAPPTDAGLPLKNRAGPFPFDRQCYGEHQREGDYQQNGGDNQIRQAPHLTQRSVRSVPEELVTADTAHFGIIALCG
jgi:hypothetical protein